MQCSNVCFSQDLLRDILSGSDSDSECDASSGNCGDFGHVLHVADPPLRRRCIQVVRVVDDFCFLKVPLRSDFGVGDVEFLQERRHQEGATELGPGRLRPAFVTELGPTELGPVLSFKG